MQPIRQIFNDAPSSLPLPLELHHKKVEIIIWPLHEQTPSEKQSFKNLLMRMPDVGTYDDFARQQDYGRGEEIWDI